MHSDSALGQSLGANGGLRVDGDFPQYTSFKVAIGAQYDHRDFLPSASCTVLRA